MGRRFSQIYTDNNTFFLNFLIQKICVHLRPKWDFYTMNLVRFAPARFRVPEFGNSPEPARHSPETKPMADGQERPACHCKARAGRWLAGARQKLKPH